MKWFWIIAIGTLLAWQAPARAEAGVADSVVSRVESEGFSVTKVTITWLGRLLITARNEDYLREVVLNRKSGDILRDSLFLLPNSRLRLAEPERGERNPSNTNKASVSILASGTKSGKSAVGVAGSLSVADTSNSIGKSVGDPSGDTSGVASRINSTDSAGNTSSITADVSSGDAAGEETDDASEDQPAEASGDASNGVSGDTSDDASGDASSENSDDTSSDISGDTSGETSDETSGETSGETSDGDSDDASEDSSGNTASDASVDKG